MSEPPRELVDRIVARQLGDLLVWEPPTLKRGPGPFQPEVFSEFRARRDDLVKDLTNLLRLLPEGDLRGAYTLDPSARSNPLGETCGRHPSMAKRIVKIRAEVPPWFAGGLNVAHKKADLGYWYSYASYSLPEATLLSVGLEPRSVNYSSLFEAYGLDTRIDEVLYFIEDRYEAISRGLGVTPDTDERVESERFLDWLVSKKVKADAKLLKLAKLPRTPARAAAPEPPLASPTIQTPVSREAKLHGHSLKLHARIIAAMAVAYLRLDKRNIVQVAKKVSDAVELQGLTADRAQVKSLLAAGLAQIEEGLKQEERSNPVQNTKNSSWPRT